MISAQRIIEIKIFPQNQSRSLKLRNIYLTAKICYKSFEGDKQATCKSANKSIDLNHKLEPTEEYTGVDKEMYQRLIGKLIYL